MFNKSRSIENCFNSTSGSEAHPFESDLMFEMDSNIPKNSNMISSVVNENSNRPSFNMEFSELMEKFNSDVQKTVIRKQKQFRKFVQDSLKGTEVNVSGAIESQLSERSRKIKKFKADFYSVVEEANAEMERIKQMENIFQELLNSKKSKREKENQAYLQRLQDLEKLNKEFSKEMADLEANHKVQNSGALAQLKKRLSRLQSQVTAEGGEKAKPRRRTDYY